MKTRVLTALEDEYRAYREVLAAGVEPMRPGVQVSTTLPAPIEEEAARFDPQVIICGSSGAADPENVTAWIGLFTGPSLPTVVRLGGGAASNKATPPWKRCWLSSMRPGA